MFVNRNARAKLANMGGILASSPEMVDATQRFAPGGTVTTDASGATGTFTVDPQPSFLERLREDIMKKIRNNEPFTEQDRQVIETINNGSGGIMQKIDEIFAPNAKTAREERGQNIIESNLPLGDADDEAPAILDIPLASAEILSEPEIAPERINVNSAELLDTSDNDRARRGPGRTAMDFSTETIPTASVDDDEASLMERIDEIFAPAAGDNLKEVQEKGNQLQEENKGAVTSDPPDDGTRAGQKPNAEVEEVEDAESLVEGFDSVVPLLLPENLEELEKIATKSDDPNEAVSNAVGNAVGVDFSKLPMPERIKEYKKILSGLMGDEEEDKKEEFWMNMAMVGFAIAAGDSPNTMKNVADGLLAGTSQMTKNKAKAKSQDRELSITAFGEAMSDERAANKFSQDKILAEIRAGGGKKAPNRATMINNILSTMSKSLKYINTPIEQQMIIAGKLVDSMPEYGGKGTPTTIQTVPSPAEGATATNSAGDKLIFTNGSWKAA